MTLFRDALYDSDLADLGFKGVWYTWEHGRLADNNIRERLDRAVANPSWWSRFPGYNVTHLNHSISDYCPLLIELASNNVNNARVPEHFFRFDANWILEEDLEHEIRSFWESSTDPLPTKLVGLGSKLMLWGKTRKKANSSYKRRLQKRLNELSSMDPDDEKLLELTEVKLGLNLEADKEEIFWEQRARQNWLRHGDKNTSFFHNYASYRKRKTTVKGLHDEEGNWIEGNGNLLNLATTYFTQLFNTSNPLCDGSIYEKVQPRVSNDMNRRLLAPFTLDEVKEAIKHMAPMKASGLDGFPALFYQKYWHVVGEEVSSFCLQALNANANLETINDTQIVLVRQRLKLPKT
ncbi:hypothetical protein like AT1G43760 [Hibiscus trionum]|uniref:Reverse transcriptase n=1 Tax=Hibiscus trionum TaxID=183268 RepID=A0A9W7IA65_HIBTR|nr:hypothetical protein like AT1G43760 [Hibiscus trionum]